MRKAMIVLTILLVFAVMVSGCASKAPAPAPDPSTSKPSADVSIGNNDIPAVTGTEGIAIEEPDLSAETDVDFGSLI